MKMAALWVKDKKKKPANYTSFHLARHTYYWENTKVSIVTQKALII